MKRYYLILMMLTVLIPGHGQNERKVIRDGVKAYEEGAFDDAEVQFRKAGSINEESFEADFNTGTALYGQEKYEETVKEYEKLLEKSEQKETTANIWHNIGNSLLEAQQYAPSIEAYKNSLRNNPTDEDSRYNLAYAKQKLKEQEQQQEQSKQDQDKQNQDKQDQDKQDQEQQPVPREISKEDANRMLKAIQQQEKDVKEKVDKKKAAAAKVKTEKDW